MFTKPRLIHRRGLRSAQPAANAVGVGEGTLYYVTDEGVLERSTGSAWQAYSSGGSASITGTLTSGRVPFATGTHVLGDDAELTYDATNNILGAPRLLLTGGAVPPTPSAGTGILFAATAGGHTAPSYIDSAGFVLRMTRDLTLLVNNNTASTIVRGRACYFSGASVANIPTIGLAEADQFDAGVPRAAAGLTLEDIAAGADGVILLSGLISNLDTSLLTQGATVYLSATAGRYSSTPPAAGGSFIQPLGNCTRSHATLGSIELDVEAPATVLIRNLTATRIPFIATGPIFDDDAALTWDDTAKTLQLTTGNLLLGATAPGAGTLAVVLGDGTIPSSMASNTAGLYANDVAGTVNMFAINEAGNASQLTGFTQGSVIFAGSTGGFTEDTQMFWDASNNRLALGPVPASILSRLLINNSATVEEPITPLLGYCSIHLQSNNAAGDPSILIDDFGGPGSFNFRRANGTQAAKTGLVADDVLFNLRTGGYTSAGAYANDKALIRSLATETWSATANGMKWEIWATPDGSASPSIRLMVTGRGNILINDSAGASEPATGTKSLILGDGTVPATLASNTCGIYGNDVGGTVNVFAINEAGESNQLSGDITLASGKFFVSAVATFLMKTTVALTNGAGALTATLTNSPVTGNPTKWIPISDNGTTRYIPAW